MRPGALTFKHAQRLRAATEEATPLRRETSPIVNGVDTPQRTA